MNILKQLNESGWPWGTCSDLVEWLPTHASVNFINLCGIVKRSDHAFTAYYRILHEANTELRKPLSIEDFGENGLFEGWDIENDSLDPDFYELTKAADSDNLGYWPMTIQFSPEEFRLDACSGNWDYTSHINREDFIRVCKDNNISLFPTVKDTYLKG